MDNSNDNGLGQYLLKGADQTMKSDDLADMTKLT